MSYIRRLIILCCLLLPWIFSVSLIYVSFSNTGGFEIFTIFLLIPAAFNIYINEKMQNFNLAVILKALFAVAMMVIFNYIGYFFDFGKVIQLGIFTVALITFFANTENLEQNRIIPAIGLNALMYYGYYVTGMDFYLKYAILCLSVSLICLFIINYLDNFFMVIVSRYCNTQPKNTLKHMKEFSDKTFRRYFGIFIAVLGAITLYFFVGNVGSNYVLEIGDVTLFTEEELNSVNALVAEAYVPNEESDTFYYDYLSEELGIPDSTGDEDNFLKAINMLYVVGGAILVVVALYYLNSYVRKADKDNSLEIDEIIEEDDIDSDSLKFKLSLGFRNERETIRKYFERKIRQHVKSGNISAKKSQTANMISNSIGRVEDISVLNDIYHKARYTQDEINKEMVKLVKQSLKK